MVCVLSSFLCCSSLLLVWTAPPLLVVVPGWRVLLSFPFSGLRLIRDVLRSATRRSGSGCRRRADVACLTGRYRWRDSWWCGRYCWRPGRWSRRRRWSRSRRCCVGYYGWSGRWRRQDWTGRFARRSWRCCRRRDAGCRRSAGRCAWRLGRPGKIGSSGLLVYDRLAGLGFGNDGMDLMECDGPQCPESKELERNNRSNDAALTHLLCQRMQEEKIETPAHPNDVQAGPARKIVRMASMDLGWRLASPFPLTKTKTWREMVLRNGKKTTV